MKDNGSHSDFIFQIEPKHYEKHNYLTYCNDVLVSILKYVDQEKISSIKIEFRSEIDAHLFKKIEKDSEDWQSWLMEHGYTKELYEAYYRHTFFSLVVDFCHYMLESINCAAKMNVSVSYALLRKPLKDTLGYIEWLCVDKDELLGLLTRGSPKELEIYKEKARIHTSAIEEKYGGNSYFNFRYNKSDKTSLEHIWNNANHLITTKYSLSKTEPGNLNFIFAEEGELRHFSDYYYITVPAIMQYATNLICDMFESFAPLNRYTILMNHLNRALKAFALVESSSFNDMKEIIDNYKLPIICPQCGLKMKMTNNRMSKFFSGKCVCSRCRYTIKTNQYIFDWQKIDFVEI